jgi:DNA-binding MarR family transcriptional regulator
MNEKPRSTRRQQHIHRFLASLPLIAGACELDLLIFFYRHPRTLLTTEQLAGFVGYDMNQIARSIDAFIGAGLLERTQNSMHAARMYLLVLDRPHGRGLKALLELASTSQGRREVLQVLTPEGPSSLGLTQARGKLHAIA